MLKPFSRFYPDDDNDKEEQEDIETMSGFSVELTPNGKIYKDSTGVKKGVWRLPKLIEKLREFRRQGDTDLSQAMWAMHAKLEEIQASGSEMEKRWIADCHKVWLVAHERVSEEPAPAPAPAPTTTTKPSLFKRKEQ